MGGGCSSCPGKVSLCTDSQRTWALVISGSSSDRWSERKGREQRAYKTNRNSRCSHMTWGSYNFTNSSWKTRKRKHHRWIKLARAWQTILSGEKWERWNIWTKLSNHVFKRKEHRSSTGWPQSSSTSHYLSDHEEISSNPEPRFFSSPKTELAYQIVKLSVTSKDPRKQWIEALLLYTCSWNTSIKYLALI